MSVAEYTKLRTQAVDDLRLSMKLLVSAANNDRDLLFNKNWQDAMTYLNRLLNNGKNKGTKCVDFAR